MMVLSFINRCAKSTTAFLLPPANEVWGKVIFSINSCAKSTTTFLFTNSCAKIPTAFLSVNCCVKSTKDFLALSDARWRLFLDTPVGNEPLDLYKQLR